jgi:phage terminase Nu1 subunit (DNA packaging protein)
MKNQKYAADIEDLLGDSDLISETDLAILLSVTAQNIRALVADGIIKRRGRGLYGQTQAVQSYCARLREQARKRGTADPELRAEKIRIAKEQADKLELANAAARRELLPAVEVENSWAGTLREIRAAFLALPGRLQQRLPHLTAHDARTIDGEIRAVLAELAGG